MQEVKEIMEELASLGKENTRKIFRNHGCEAELFGVSVADQKSILKRYKKRHDIALELFKTKNADAQYLAGLMALPTEFTREELMNWVDLSTWHMVHEYALAWNIAESNFAESIVFELLKSNDPEKRQIAWSALGHYVCLERRPELDEKKYVQLVSEIERTLQQEENRVKLCMVQFLIALGASEESFTEICMKAAKNIGKVEVFMGKTACKVPEVVHYLEKIKSMNRIGKKKRTVKC